ncbi:cytochrome P450 [Streptomyces sp. AV19]|uniref:cytochrome P450 n=1 Tax=Streptomyces sp. AV19 TaxID=2793068 RepID=UPI0018FE7376|nr:cytochrome P450 [Streptomyces sp. AV19]MBH1937777.1 cytochrome P450 [Streptomyces sp. AV19]MDG4533665.1 cytochrome P450 [Streptomyces sp. AV19]
MTANSCPFTNAMPPQRLPFSMASAPGALPLLGHAIKMLRAPQKFLASLPSHGDLVEVRMGPWRIHVLCHPELVHRVLTTDKVFDKGGPMIDRLRMLIGDGLASCPHDRHRRRRRLVQPAFQRKRLSLYADVMTEQITGVTSAWRDGQVLDLHSEMSRISTRVLAGTMFTADFCGSAIATVSPYSEMIAKDMTRRLLTPEFLRRVPTRGKRRFDRVTRDLHSAVLAMADRYRRTGTDRGDLMSMLLEARDDGDRLSDEEIFGEVVTMILAGTETVAYTLDHAFRFLARHPGVEEELHAEVDSVLNGRSATWDDLPRLGLAERILRETLRLNPNDWLVTRQTTEDTELAGRLLPAGSLVAYCGYAIHRRADLYPQPERFLPGRWENQQRLPSDGTFLAFGEGGRRCIGDVFGMVEGTLALSTIAARWRFESVRAGRLRPTLRMPCFARPKSMRAVAR